MENEDSIQNKNKSIFFMLNQMKSLQKISCIIHESRLHIDVIARSGATWQSRDFGDTE